VHVTAIPKRGPECSGQEHKTANHVLADTVAITTGGNDNAYTRSYAHLAILLGDENH
jgi:hypothetical protein